MAETLGSQLVRSRVRFPGLKLMVIAIDPLLNECQPWVGAGLERNRFAAAAGDQSHRDPHLPAVAHQLLR